MRAHADRAAAALKNLISTREVNARLLVGLALVGIITPIADVMYTWMPTDKLFPESQWYYESIYWLFLCIGPYIQIITGFFGAYLILFPEWNKKGWLLIAPICFASAKIVWLISVQNHEQFLSVPPMAYFIYATGFVCLLLYVTNYLAWRKYHRSDAHKSRMDGLCQIANMNNPVEAGFVKTWNDIKNKNY